MGLDPWQLERQVALLLASATWADPPNAAVLTGGAKVSADGVGNFAPGSFLGDGPVTLAPPFALVEVLSVDADEDVPARVDRARVRVTVVAGGGGVAGWTGSTTTHDSHGIKSTIGGTRDPIQGQGKSTGRGVDEVLWRLIEVLGNGRLVDSTHAFQGFVAVTGPIIPVDGHQVVARELEIEVYTAGVERFYHPIRRLKATPGVGTIALTWKNAPARYDTLRNVVRRSAPGGPAPALVTDGIDVPLAGALDESVSPAGLAAGTYAVSVFVAYDETTAIPTTADRHSGPVSFTGVVVT